MCIISSRRWPGRQMGPRAPILRAHQPAGQGRAYLFCHLAPTPVALATRDTSAPPPPRNRRPSGALRQDARDLARPLPADPARRPVRIAGVIEL